MSRIHDSVERLRRVATQDRAPHGLKLRSSILLQTAGEEAALRNWDPRQLAEDARNFWMACRSARLFEDVEYGQWGLVLLDPLASWQRTAAERASRPNDLAPQDVVIGEFLGDQELLVLCPSETGSRRVLVALPLDPRADWFGVADDLSEFLDRYSDAEGLKYWEQDPAKRP